MKEVAIRILHKFLICLGDLTRYQLEYDPNGCSKQSSKYYLMSLMLLPTNGMPLNQLGTLFGSVNYGCDAAYYYLYSLSCTDPFLGARENLKLLFSKNRKRYSEIKSKHFIDRSKLADYDLEELKTKEIKKFLVIFLNIIDMILSQTLIFNSGINNQIDNHQLQELCQICLQQFNSCLFYLRNDQNESYLSDDLVFKLVLLILMSIEQLKSKKLNSTVNTNIYFTSVAFALVFFSHIVNHTIIRFQESLFSLDKRNKPVISLEGEMEEENCDEDGKESSCVVDKGLVKDKTQKKKLRLIYGHRRRKHNSDSDTNDSLSDEDAESSEVTEEPNDDDEGTIVQSSDSGSRSLRNRRENNRRNVLMKKRRVNVAKFLERENLSETEINPDLSESSECSTSSSEASSGSSNSVKIKKEKKISS